MTKIMAQIKSFSESYYEQTFDITSESCSSTIDSTEEEFFRLLFEVDRFLAASQMHEQSGQFELALEDVEQALEFLDRMAQKFDPTWLEGSHGWQGKYNHFTLRKGAILLALGKKEEAVELFLNHQPKDIATVLLYRFIEQKFHVQLLSLKEPTQDVSEQSDLQRATSLFLAGRYDEAELILKNDPYGGGLLRPACLTMLGRMEEARELLKGRLYLDAPDKVMLDLLLGDLPDQCWQNTLLWKNWEWLNKFPILPFVATRG